MTNQNTQEIASLKELMEIARKQALEQDKGGTWTATLESDYGNDITTHVHIEVVGESNRHARLEGVEYEPGPDIMITDGGDYFQNRELEQAILEANTTIRIALEEHDVRWDSIDARVEYTELGNEKRINDRPIWISESETERLIDALQSN